MTALTSPALAAVLDREHAAAHAEAATRRAERAEGAAKPREPVDFRVSERHRTAYLAVGPDQGRFLHGVAIAINAKEIVEFGTSHGISTMYLAAAAQQTGGRVIGSEFHATKADRAIASLSEAGLKAEIRIGDAMTTLAGAGPVIDLLFLDGAKDMYLPILRLLEPRLRIGSVVIADNIPTDSDVMTPFLAAVQAVNSGYVTSRIGFGKGGMSYSVRVANQAQI
ncbi:class I SAM-dependent methyltransferase [Paracoccus sp. Z330]|uniref:Class I SAM-dependent methyltransferase n=1 Tax=Paracoccus onchidii TaxID=3017813 RepID=A0ABT4ZJJ0_9RHOB|nr:class I SAM-dependent methyltransferase [Paracoccus onchidii]MDB6179533.1 class I SAM-dependent methyltransferase [Paracoccus onchidii]